MAQLIESKTTTITIDLIGLYIPFNRLTRESVCVGFEFGVFENGELKQSYKIAYDDTFLRKVKNAQGEFVMEDYPHLLRYDTEFVYVEGVQQFEEDGVTPLTTQVPVYETRERHVKIGEREFWEQMLGRPYIWPPSERTLVGIKESILAQVQSGKTIAEACQNLETFIKSQQ